jgi:hypothetical protein
MYRKVEKQRIRSNSYNGDPREPFNENLVERNARKFRRVSMAHLLAISSFFSGCMVSLREMFPLTLQETGGQASRDLFKDTLFMIDQLNNDDVTKNADIQRTSLFEVLAKLERTREISNKLKKK